jgi:hypothetical protein
MSGGIFFECLFRERSCTTLSRYFAGQVAGDLIAVSGNIVVTLLLYGIFKPVNRGLSLLAASFNPRGTHLWGSSIESSGHGHPRGI